MVEYKDRLADALGTLPIQKLADHLGISYQAVKKVLSGSSGAFSAPNNTKAAEFLGVSSDWLAVGAPYEKSRRATRPTWPFKAISEDRIRALEPADLARFEGAAIVAAAQIGVTVGQHSQPMPQEGAKNEGIPSIVWAYESGQDTSQQETQETEMNTAQLRESAGGNRRGRKGRTSK